MTEKHISTEEKKNMVRITKTESRDWEAHSYGSVDMQV
jgi:hypothetical protein